MQIGVVVPRQISSATGGLAAIAEAVERLGYESLWLTEHIAVPADIRSRYPYSDDGRPEFGADAGYPEAMVALAFAAAVTKRVRLGTAVIPMITRDPVSMAKQAATVDRLAGGRLELGIGAGWLTEEADALGHAHDHRGERLDEAIDILREAWTSRTFEHRGPHWSLPEIGVHPHPVQGGDVPIWIGGTSPAAIRTTNERATGNILWLPGPDEVASMRGRLVPGRRLAAATPFDPAAGGDQLARVRELEAAGADRVLLVPPAEVEAAIGALSAFAGRLAEL